MEYTKGTTIPSMPGWEIIVGFVNDNDGSFPLVQGKPVDLFLNDVKAFCFSVGRLCAQRGGEISVEIIDCNGRKAGIDHFIQGRIQSGRPGTHLVPFYRGVVMLIEKMDRCKGSICFHNKDVLHIRGITESDALLCKTVIDFIFHLIDHDDRV